MHEFQINPQLNFTIELPRTDIIAHAFKDAFYFAYAAVDLPAARSRNPEQPGSSQFTLHRVSSGRF